ncbi:MAG: carbohydrate ABC transporter permease [Thermomicrobiales bacterium]
MQTATRVARPARHWRQSLAWLTGDRGIIMPLLFLFPFLVFFGVFLLYPIGYGFYISLTSWDLLTDPQWVGLDNYRRLLDDVLFEKSLRNTAFYVVLNVPLVVVIPLFLAVLVDHPIFGRGIFRSIFTTPLMMSVTTVSLLWVWFLNPTFGLINHYSGMIGLPEQYWLNRDPWSLVAIVVTSVWWGTGFNLVLFLAGLQDIPEELYDAAKVDGAGAWSLFWNITLPGLRATLLFVTATTIIASFRVFGQVFVMTQGGPYDSSRTIVLHIYENGFRNFRMGGASAVAWVMFLIVAVFTLVQFRLLRNKD